MIFELRMSIYAMKKLLTLILLLLVEILPAFGQIIFDSTHAVSTGASMLFLKDSLSGTGDEDIPTYSLNSANQSWSIPDTWVDQFTDSVRWNYKPLSSYSQSQYFPTASYIKEVVTYTVLKLPGGLSQMKADTSLRFYRRDNKRGLFYIGSRSVNSTSTSIDLSEILEIPFQVSLGSIHRDTVRTITYSLSNQDSIKKVFQDIYRFDCEASGNFNLLGSTYPALAVDRTLIERDTVYKKIAGSNVWQRQSSSSNSSSGMAYYLSPQIGDQILIGYQGPFSDGEWTATCFKKKSMNLTLADQIPEASPILVYPNPGNGIIRIDGLPGDSEIRITDAKGKFYQQIATKQESTVVSDLKPGIYFIQLSDKDKKTISNRKIIVE